jgi:tetratricopeptide (TPR) repeat protein
MWPNLEATATALYALSGAPAAVQDQEAARLLIYLARCLHTFCVFRGYWDEGLRLHTWAYEVAILLGEWQQASWRAYDAARVFCYRAETEQAAAWVERMIAAASRGGTRRDWAVATSLRGQIALQRGDLDEAEQCGLEALTAFRDLGARRDQAVLLNDLGSIARKKHDVKRAQRFFRQGLDLASQLNDKRLQATMTGNLGAVALDRNRLQAAHHWYERQLALALELGRYDVKASAQTGRALVLAREGRHADALPLAEEALSIRQRLRERTLDETQQLVQHLRQQVGQQ